MKAKAKSEGTNLNTFKNKIRSELKTTDQVRKDRILKEKRREKNARPSRKNGKVGKSGKSGKPNRGGKRR